LVAPAVPGHPTAGLVVALVWPRGGPPDLDLPPAAAQGEAPHPCPPRSCGRCPSPRPGGAAGARRKEGTRGSGPRWAGPAVGTGTAPWGAAGAGCPSPRAAAVTAVSPPRRLAVEAWGRCRSWGTRGVPGAGPPPRGSSPGCRCRGAGAAPQLVPGADSRLCPRSRGGPGAPRPSWPRTAPTPGPWAAPAGPCWRGRSWGAAALWGTPCSGGAVPQSPRPSPAPASPHGPAQTPGAQLSPRSPSPPAHCSGPGMSSGGNPGAGPWGEGWGVPPGVSPSPGTAPAPNPSGSLVLVGPWAPPRPSAAAGSGGDTGPPGLPGSAVAWTAARWRAGPPGTGVTSRALRLGTAPVSPGARWWGVRGWARQPPLPPT